MMQLGTKNSLLFTLQGSIEKMFITDAFHKGIELTGTLTGKSTSQLSELLGNSEIPDIGPLSGKLLITGDSNNLVIPQISLFAGRKNHLMLTAAGKIAEVPLRRRLSPRGVEIVLTVTAPGSDDLSVVLGSGIPDFGPLLIKGVLIGDKGIFSIKDFRLIAGKPKQPEISISGSVEDVLSTKGVHMKVLFDEKTLVKLFDLHSIPELGALKGSALLFNVDGNFGLKELKLESGNSELIDLKINGAIENIAKTNDISVNVDISIKNPTVFGRLFATDLSGVSPVFASGRVSGNKNKVTFNGNAVLGKTILNNDLAVFFINEKTNISGTINSPNLVLKDFGVISELFTTKSSKDPVLHAKPGKAVIFSDTQLPVQLLHKVDLDLKLKIARVKGRDYHFDRVKINLLLQNSRFTVRPVSFDYSGGQVSINAEIDAVGAIGIPKWSVNMQANNIQLGEVFRQEHKTPPIEGELNLIVDLKSSGISEHMIASNLNGEIGLTLENGGINRSNLEMVFLNPLGWVFSHGINDNEFSITCGLARYQVKQGVVRSKLFLMDGPKLLVRGNAEVNLARETINSLYNLEKKNIFRNTFIPSLATTSVPIKITGSLANPDFELVNLSSIKSNADRYIFAPVATVPRELVGTVLDIFKAKKAEQSPCQTYLQN